MKDIGSPLHDLSEEEQEILQGIIDVFYAQFLDVVKAGRKDITSEKLSMPADGRVFTAEQAKQEGLMDRIGYADDAVKWAKEIIKVLMFQGADRYFNL